LAVRSREVSRAYADALCRAAAEGLAEEIEVVYQKLKSANLIFPLNDPSLEFSKKQAMILDVLPSGISEKARNTAFLLASKNQMKLLPEIIDELRRLARGGAERKVAHITTAVPLAEREQETMRERVMARFDGDLDFHFVVDGSILGGVIVRVGDRVIDGSVAGKLAVLGKRLREG
jgi:F-type H+-transporting ATPase subunit delta